MTQAAATKHQAAVPDTAGRPAPPVSYLSPRLILTAWGLSLLFHAGLFVVMLALVFPFSPEKQPPVRPVARIDLVGSVDGSAFSQRAGRDLPLPAAQPTSVAEHFQPRKFTALSELTTTRRPELTIIGIGTGGGDVARYGLGIGGTAAPAFFGLGGSTRGVRTVIYVVDMSGSMLDTFEYVKQELRRSITALRRSQKFHLILFNHKPPLESPPGRLVNAVASRKKKLFEFLDSPEVTPHGGTRPLPALHRALALKPDLIYLLSDGQGFPFDLLARLRQWNENQRTRISTIAYLDASGSTVLEAIARDNRGEFKIVTDEELP